MKKYQFLCLHDSKAVHAYPSQCPEPFAQSIDTASNDAEGVEKYMENSRASDVIFIDWEMPILNAPSIIQNLSPLGIKIPVIMLTSKNKFSDIVRMIEAGVADYILKPFTGDLVREKLAYVLENN